MPIKSIKNHSLFGMLRLVGLLMCLFMLSPALASAQKNTGTPITYKCENEKLSKALSEVERLSGYYRLQYLSEDVSPYRVSGSFDKASVETVVTQLLKATPLRYNVNGRYIEIYNPKGKAAKTFSVSGSVTDEEGEPLVGAIIAVSGTDYGAIADTDGKFSLKINTVKPVLSVSYVGMLTCDIPVSESDASKPLSVVLRPAVEMMSEVVVTGYQEIKKEKMTGSVATVSSAKLEERYTQNLLANLEGHVAGLSTYGGKPVIRGAGTLYGSTAPLLVVDGMPIEGSIEDLNPYDIESVNVLKDAAAAAIYGARAANGIIVITTKNAKHAGKIDIDFATNITWYEKRNVDYADNYYMTPAQQIAVESDYWEYAYMSGEKPSSVSNMERELSNGYSISPLEYAYYQLAKGEINRNQLEATKALLSNNNFAKDLADNMLHRQVVQQYNLSLRQSSDKARNNIVVNYKHDNVGKYNHHNDWFNVYYKGSFDLAKWLTATVSINGVYSNVQEYGGDYSTENIYDPFGNLPYVSYKNADGSTRPFYYGGYGNEYTQYWSLQDGIADMIVNPRQEALDNVQTTRRQEMRYHADLLFKILPGLTADAQFIYEVTAKRMRNYANENSWSARNMKNGYAIYKNGKVQYLTPENGGILKTENVDGNYWTLRGQLNYTRKFFDKHEISAIAGTEFRQTRMWGEKQLLLGYDDQLQTSANHTVDFNTLKSLGYKAPYWKIGTYSSRISSYQFQSNQGIVPEVRHRYASGYFNATYTYDDRYNLFGSYRKDYADVYGLNAKFRGKPLWSVGAGWNIHNEDFMHDYTWLDFLKLRYSYGVTGNIYQGVTSYMTATTGLTNHETNVPYGEIGSPANPNLRWEQNRTHNVGIDFSLFDYRLRGNVDYYRKEGRDIFGNKLLDATTGFSAMNANVASILNQGIELSVGYDWFRPSKINDFSWTTNVTFSYNTNEVTYVENPQTSAYGLINTPYKTGYPVNTLWMLQFAGIDDTPGSEGQQLYYNGYGEKVHEVYFYGDAAALAFGGQSDPKVIVGLDNQMKWRDFSIGFLLAYYGGHKMFCLPFRDRFEGDFYGPVASYYLDSWTPDNPSDVPAIGQWAHSSSTDSAPDVSSRALHDADFIKFRNIVFGYDVPVSLLRHLGVNRCSLRFQINDPNAIWTKDKTDFDPETGGLRTPSSYVFCLNINL